MRHRARPMHLWSCADRIRRAGGVAVVATALIAPLALVAAGPANADPSVPADPGGPERTPDRGFGALIAGQENGRAAITELGPQIADAAARNGMTVSGLIELLREDSSAWVDTTGRVFYIDTFEGHAEASTSTADGGTAERAPFPYEQTFRLDSKPSSKRTIYLDFDGQLISGTAWNRQGVSSTKPQPAFDTDGSPTTFSQAERDVIQGVWQRVSEDYAPFDVNVTTADPGTAALRRTGSADQEYGVRALITPAKVVEERLCFVCAGVAYIGTFDEIDTGGRKDFFEPAWVFPDAAHSNAKDIAETVSHEVGHNLGLEHDGLRAQEYYDGHDGWAPIMGTGYSQPVTQWSKGEYAGANNGQNDITVMGRNGAKVRPDDHGDEAAGATALEGETMINGRGIITSAADEDYFEVVRSCAGTLAVTATPAPQSPNLDIRLQLLDRSGAVLDTANPAAARVNRDVANGLGASVSTPASAGTYYVEVDGVGEGARSGGYSAYGSIGSYTLQATGCGAPAAPTSLAVSKDLPGSTATLSWQPPANDGGHPVTGYTATLRTGGATTHTVELDTAARSHTFSGLAEGATYTAQLTASNHSGTGPPVSTTFTMVAVAPSAPTRVGLTVLNQDRAAYLKWRPPAEVGDSPVTGYVVQRTGGTPQTLSASARSNYFDGLVYGTEYTFTVQAVSDSGAGPAVARVATLVEPSPPSAPRDLRGTPGDGSVTLDWRPPANAGTSRVIGYEFTAYKADGTKVGSTDFVEVEWLMGTRSNPEWLVWDLRNGQAYKFGVRACSNDGCSKKAWTGLITPHR